MHKIITILTLSIISLLLMGCLPESEFVAKSSVDSVDLLAKGGKNRGDQIAPSTVENLSAVAKSCSSVQLSWSAATDNDSGIKFYHLYRDNRYMTKLNRSNLSHLDESVSSNANHEYYIISEDFAGNRSLKSDVAAVDVPPCNLPPEPEPDPDPVAPAAASNLSATDISSTSVSLKWHDNSSNETGFLVQRCTGADCTDFETIATVGANQTFYIDNNVEADTSYCYRVIAINLDLLAIPSNKVCYTTLSDVDPSGQAFVQQFGTALKDNAMALAKDSQDNIYVAGYTMGSINGFVNQGYADIVVAKIYADGALAWIQQIGTTASDVAHELVVDDNGFIYLVGNMSNNGFVLKLDSNGSEVWRHMIDPGSPGVVVSGAALGSDSAGAFLAVSGTSSASFGSSVNAGKADPFVGKLRLDGSLEWIETLTGTAESERSSDVAVDSQGNIYTIGQTQGAMPGQIHLGSYDLYLAKFSTNGSLQWLKQFGYDTYDSSAGIAISRNDEIYIGGKTYRDVILAKFNSDGSTAFSKRILNFEGSLNGSEGLYAVAIDEQGNFYGTGHSCTRGKFVQKYSSVDGSPLQTWSRLGVAPVDNLSQTTVTGLVITSDGGIAIGGLIKTAYEGFVNAGEEDMYVKKFMP